MLFTVMIIFTSGFLQNISGFDNGPLDTKKYFSELEDDMTKISWFHRCNSRKQLDEALASDVMMIEADIVSGHLTGASVGPPIPIMGHPPATTGDISLEQFLDTVLQQDANKGVKLDFKSLDVFKSSENILEQFLSKAEVDFPVWVNADILQGPGSERKVVEPNYFLHTCVHKFPLAMISAGWAVDVTKAKDLNYNSSHVDQMTSLLGENQVVYPVTFPVHAGIASNSGETLARLIHTSVSGTSLTLWCGQDEWVDYAKLRNLIAELGKDKVYVDMPPDMKDKLFNPQEGSSASIIATSCLVFLSSLLLML